MAVIMVGFGLRAAYLDTLPLSLSLDEATNGLDALQLFRLRRLTPFLQNNFGRETLFFYMQGVALWLYGISFFALRFVAALAGTVTIPLLYVVGRRLLGSRQLGLLAATGLTVSYWHVYFSRLGLRANLLLPVLLVLVWCFWRGWFPSPPCPPLPEGEGEKSLPSPRGRGPGDRRKEGLLLLAGGLLGLAFYTYLAARLLPFLLAAFVLIDLAAWSNAVRRHKAINFLGFNLVALLVAAPLAVYFWQHPAAWSSRAGAISILATPAPLTTLSDNLLALLQIHFGAGSWLGQWPALDLLVAPSFLVGLVACAGRVRRPAYFFLLLWWAIGTLPVLLSLQDWEARTTLLRGIAAWPALYLIAAIGLGQIGEWVNKRSLDFVVVVGGLWLLVGGGTTVYNYFLVWAGTYDTGSDHPTHIARYLNQQQGQATLVPLNFYAETVAYFLLQAGYPTLENLDEASTAIGHRPDVILLPDGEAAVRDFALLAGGKAYLLPPLTPAQVDALVHHARRTPPLSTLRDGEGEPIAQIYPAPFLPLAPPGVQPLRASFDGEILLAGWQVEPAIIRPGEAVTLRLVWQAERPLDGDYDLFIHLFDVAGRRRYGQINAPLTGILFDAYRWPVGLRVPGLYRFDLPPDAPEGAYRFEVGLYRPATGERLQSGNQLLLGKVRVQSASPPPPQHPLVGAQFGEQITLLGLDLAPAPLRVREALTYTLHWRADSPISRDYTVFTHLIDAAGTLRAGQDNMPQEGQYPTSWWDAGEVVRDPYTLSLPPDLEPGRYTLRVGLYDAATGQRLTLAGAGQDFVEWPGLIIVEE